MDAYILVVDPSGVIRFKMREIITQSGYHPVLSMDGEDALTKIKSGRYSIKMIVMEWVLPHLSGLDVLKIIKKSPHRAIPIVVVTSESTKTSVIKALQNGASDYVIKPFSKEQMKQKIENFVQK